MSLQAGLYLVPYALSLALCLGVAIFAWRRKVVIGARTYAMVALGQVIWFSGFILELLNPTLGGKLFWDHMQWPGVLLVPAAWFVFSLEQIGRDLRHRAQLWTLVFVIPLLLWVALIIGSYTGPFRSDAAILPMLPFGDLTYSYNTLDWILALDVYLLFFAGIFLLANHLRKVQSIYRLQTALVLTACLIPVIAGFAALADVRILGHRDIAPITFGISNLLVTWALFRYRLFDLVPVAREAVIASMTDSIIVLDSQRRIVDINPAALTNLGKLYSDVIGQAFDQVYAPWSDLIQRFGEVEQMQTELSVVALDGRTRHIDLRVSPVRDKRNHLVGRVIVSREITTLKQVQQAELEQRMVAEALIEITTALNSTLNLDDLFEVILNQIERVVPYRRAEIALLQEGNIYVVGSRNIDSDKGGVNLGLLGSIKSLPIAQAIAETGEPFLVADTEDLRHDPLLANSYLASSEWIGSYLGVPILTKHSMVGIISLTHDVHGFYTSKSGRRLQAFADQAAIALENARLYSLAKTIAVSEERQRIARNLHDSVTQTVFAATTMAELLPRVRHDAEKLDKYIVEVGLLTRSAMAEMRTLMVELQPQAITQTELSVLLKSLCDALSGNTRIPVEFIARDRIFLESVAQIAFYRVAQEALNNIQQHARASNVSVHLAKSDQRVELYLKDNGCGFDPPAAASGRGITLMQEQAARIGATLKIISVQGAGTEVVLTGAS
jgi:PAS domain S-box-containing protein